MPASTAPAAKTRILALLAGRPALSGVQVTWMSATKTEAIAPEMVYLGRVRVTGEWRALGAGRRDERYTVALGVEVRQHGEDFEAAELRSWTLLAEVSAALRSDSLLSGLLHTPAALDEIDQMPTIPGELQCGSLIDALIVCAAHFTP